MAMTVIWMAPTAIWMAMAAIWKGPLLNPPPLRGRGRHLPTISAPGRGLSGGPELLRSVLKSFGSVLSFLDPIQGLWERSPNSLDPI